MSDPATETEGAIPSTAALEPIEKGDALVRPAASIHEIEEAFRAYQRLSERLLTNDDYQTYTERGRKRQFRKRSAWRKLATAYGVSFEERTRFIQRQDPDDPHSIPVYAEFTFRAVAPNGRYADGWGACSIGESRFQRQGGRAKIHHDLPATAETRAKNRAAADLFGLGEVSAEEMSADADGGAPYEGVVDVTPDDASEPPKPGGPPATLKQVKMLVALSKQMEWDDEERHTRATQALDQKIESFKDLSKAQASHLIEAWKPLVDAAEAGDSNTSTSDSGGHGATSHPPASGRPMAGYSHTPGNCPGHEFPDQANMRGFLICAKCGHAQKPDW